MMMDILFALSCAIFCTIVMELIIPLMIHHCIYLMVPLETDIAARTCLMITGCPRIFLKICSSLWERKGGHLIGGLLWAQHEVEGEGKQSDDKNGGEFDDSCVTAQD